MSRTIRELAEAYAEENHEVQYYGDNYLSDLGPLTKGFEAGARAALDHPVIVDLLTFTKHNNNCFEDHETGCECGLSDARKSYDKLLASVSAAPGVKEGE